MSEDNISNITDSPHFRWMPGMLTTAGERVMHVYIDGVDVGLPMRCPTCRPRGCTGGE